MRLAHILRRSATFYRDRTALVCSSQRFTYGQFLERVNRLADGLSRLGAGPKDRVAVLLPNCHRFAELFLAVAQVGAVLVPLNVRLSPEELAGLIEHSEAVGLVSANPFRKTLQAMGKRLGKLTFLIGTDLEQESFSDY